MGSLLRSIDSFRSYCFQAYTAVNYYAPNVIQYIPAAASITCIATGGSLLYKAGLIDLIKNQLFKAEENDKPQKPLKPLQCLIGMSLLMYGIYSLAQGIFPLLQYNLSNDPTVVHPFHQVPTGDERAVAERVIAKVQKCPAALELWNQVVEKGRISVRITDIEKRLPSANWEPFTRTISLSSTDSFEDQVTHSIFELCNAKQNGAFMQLGLESSSGKYNVWEYVRKVVQIEWQSVQCHQDIATRCIADKTMNATAAIYDEFTKKARSFSEFWHIYSRSREHAKHKSHIWSFWVENFRGAYCRTHRDAVICKYK